MLASHVYALPRLFVNGNFRTTDLKQNGATWISVENGKVSAMGKGDGYKKITAAEIVDLGNQFIFPGLTDAHAHLADLGESMFQVDLRGSSSAEEAIGRIRAFVEKNPDKGPIVGQGWDQSDWPGKAFPTRELLDSISTDRTIVMYRIDGHAAWVNTHALKLSGLFEEQDDPKGGKLIRDQFQRPTGVLVDAAMKSLDPLLASPSPERLEKYIELATHEAAKYGITSVHDAGTTRAQLTAIKNLLQAKKVRFRFYEMVSAKDDAELTAFLNDGPILDSENGQLTVRAVKFFADGAMGSRGAAFEAPYSDDPQNKGLLQLNAEEMQEKFAKADAKGFQIAVHAIGSLANKMVLDAYEKLGKNKRPRLEHAQVLRKEDIPRIAKLGVIASMQPVHCTSDMKWVVDRIGNARARYSYPWNSLLKAKAHLAFGSDAPVEMINPWHGLFSAITRQDALLLPPQGFVPEEKITLEQAMKAFTAGSAFAAFNEKQAGTLEKGKWADFFVTKEDPFKLDPKKLRELTVVSTYVGGERIYSQNNVIVSP